MKTTPADGPVRTAGAPTLSPAAIFGLLTNDDRRYALHYLSMTVGELPVAEIADRIAYWNGESTTEGRRRALTALHHLHLPKLVDEGAVDYDVERQTVVLVAGADLVPHLRLVAAADFD
ncbi:hypothetical protein ACFQE1_16300 [Halobium palmae]|uniref:DUF7344 domain-containing protein n=1 Tax=Halobium palmae TaxID=1776492 RepID=A0ABD5S2W7_9EURY